MVRVVVEGMVGGEMGVEDWGEGVEMEREEVGEGGLDLAVLVMVGMVREEGLVAEDWEGRGLKEEEEVEVARVREEWEKEATETEAEGLGWVRGRVVMGLVGLGREDLGLVEVD